MKYSECSVLLGAEVFAFSEAIVTLPDTEGNITLLVEASVENFRELLNSELPFLKTDTDLYKFEVLFSTIIRLR